MIILRMFYLLLGSIRRRTTCRHWMQQLSQDGNSDEIISVHRTSVINANTSWKTNVQPKANCGVSRCLWSHRGVHPKYALR